MKHVFSLLLLHFLITGVAFPQDSLVHFDELKYIHDFERHTFVDHFKKEKDNYMALFMAIDPESSTKKYERIRHLYLTKLKSFDREKLTKKRADKRIKIIYDEIHQTFLKKYEGQNHFSDVFTLGNYNCVSASALYGLAFSELNIPYVIKEKPTHVYVIAYPAQERILVESTDPTGGFIVFNDKYKSTFVNQLKMAKIISEQEYADKTVSQLFDQYYFSDQEISIEELVGIQYTNDALYKLDEKQYEDAYHQLEKAYLFYPAEKVASMLMLVNIELLNKKGYKNSSGVGYLSKLMRFDDYGITDDMIMDEFGKLTNQQLINEGNLDNYKMFYNQLISNVKDENLGNEISYLYEFEMGRVLYNQGKYMESLPFLEGAYRIKPDNLDINNALVGVIGQNLRFESDNTKVIEFIENYRDKYPALMENNLFKSSLVGSYLIQAGQSFELNKLSEAIKYKGLFEKHYDKSLKVDINNIARLYAVAATYYFRRGNTPKARAIIDKGLEYAPGSHELLIRKQMIH